MSATRCRIPIGLFYGHVIVLEKEGYADHGEILIYCILFNIFNFLYTFIVMKYIKNKKNRMQRCN